MIDFISNLQTERYSLVSADPPSVQVKTELICSLSAIVLFFRLQYSVAMLAIFLKTLPFFAIIGLGYMSARTKFFSEAATAYLTKFVFYFALPAMLLKFTTNLELEDVLNWDFMLAYLVASIGIYLVASVVALVRRVSVEEAAVEAQCAVVGNIGFLGLPMLALLMGPAAVAPVMMMLTVDLFVFGALIVILITGSRDGRMSFGILKTVVLSVLKNPMIMALFVGLAWTSGGLDTPQPLQDFIDMLAGASTPCALFAIGASLAGKSAERLSVATWLSFCKLVLHPAAVAIAMLWWFQIDGFTAAVAISAAALPVAGNIYIVAQSYNAAAQRASAAILVSTVISIITASIVIGLVDAL